MRDLVEAITVIQFKLIVDSFPALVKATPTSSIPYLLTRVQVPVSPGMHPHRRHAAQRLPGGHRQDGRSLRGPRVRGQVSVTRVVTTCHVSCDHMSRV